MNAISDRKNVRLVKHVQNGVAVTLNPEPQQGLADHPDDDDGMHMRHETERKS
jgi:hypothetical protein